MSFIRQKFLQKKKINEFRFELLTVFEEQIERQIY